MAETNQNFSRVARLVDERGSTVSLRSNHPNCVVIEYDAIDGDEIADDVALLEVSQRTMSQRAEAHAELTE